MLSDQKILECVPNFSEGRNQETIDAIAAAIRSVNKVALLHIDISPAANRTVMTFAGEPVAVAEAAFRAIKKAAELIDMRRQAGVHPRIGATDVCPLVPLQHMTMDEAITYSHILGERVGRELNIPVYLYEHAAQHPSRKALPDIRKGQYEGLAEKMKLPEWKPDYGPSHFDPACGATVIGARNILVAFNVSLNTGDVAKAFDIARRLRESGYWEMTGGTRKKMKGLLPMIRAIGWYMADYDQAQVSFNLLDYRITSLLTAWNECARLASEAGISTAGSEIIGLVPEECLLEVGAYVQQQKKMDAATKQDTIKYAIEYLGLDKLKPFNPNEKVLEYALQHHSEQL